MKAKKQQQKKNRIDKWGKKFNHGNERRMKAIKVKKKKENSIDKWGKKIYSQKREKTESQKTTTKRKYRQVR